VPTQGGETRISLENFVHRAILPTQGGGTRISLENLFIEPLCRFKPKVG